MWSWHWAGAKHGGPTISSQAAPSRALATQIRPVVEAISLKHLAPAVQNVISPSQVSPTSTNLGIRHEPEMHLSPCISSQSREDSQVTPTPPSTAHTPTL